MLTIIPYVTIYLNVSLSKRMHCSIFVSSKPVLPTTILPTVHVYKVHGQTTHSSNRGETSLSNQRKLCSYYTSHLQFLKCLDSAVTNDSSSSSSRASLALDVCRLLHLHHRPLVVERRSTAHQSCSARDYSI